MSLPSALAALPNELLLMLADNLKERDLNSLLRTSRHFKALFNGYLYKLNVRNKGNTTLYWACWRGMPEVAKRVLDLGAEPEAPCTSTYYSLMSMAYLGVASETPLLCAIQYDKPGVVRVLLDRGVNIEQQGRGGQHPLEMATRDGKNEIAQMLLAAGANVNQLTPRSALHSAVTYKHLNTIKLLLNNGANPNALDEDQGTPLHLARDPETAKLLIDAGANVNVTNRWDQTPLSIAVRTKDKEWVRLLLTAGASVNDTNRKGETPLFFVGTSKDMHTPGKDSDVEITRTLLDFGSSIHHLDRDGSTALHAICYDGDEETVKLLLDSGSQATTRNRKGLTPIHIAAEEGWPHIIRLLLDHGANVNATNYYRSTPLHRMTSIPKRKLRPAGNQERYTEAMMHLLSAGANTNAQDRIGQTPLMKAAYHGYWKFVATLMDADGIDLAIKDRRGKTAAALAKDSNIESRDLGRATIAAETFANIQTVVATFDSPITTNITTITTTTTTTAPAPAPAAVAPGVVP